jgi:hypothetical protein
MTKATQQASLFDTDPPTVPTTPAEKPSEPPGADARVIAPVEPPTWEASLVEFMSFGRT